MAKEKCKIPCEVFSRVVGYLRPISSWNVGKKQEFKDRKDYLLREEDESLHSHQR